MRKTLFAAVGVFVALAFATVAPAMTASPEFNLAPDVMAMDQPPGQLSDTLLSNDLAAVHLDQMATDDVGIGLMVVTSYNEINSPANLAMPSSVTAARLSSLSASPIVSGTGGGLTVGIILG